MLLPLVQATLTVYTFGRDPVGLILAVSNQEGICHQGVGLSVRERFEHRWSCGFIEEIMNDSQQKIILVLVKAKEKTVVYSRYKASYSRRIFHAIRQVLWFVLRKLLLQNIDSLIGF